MDPEAHEKTLSEAESLLLEGHERLQEHTGHFKYKRDAVQRLARLYEAWNKPAKQAEWQQKLQALNQPQQPPLTSQTQGILETIAKSK